MHLLDSKAAHTALKNVTHVYTDLDGTLLAPGGRLLTNHDGTPSADLAEVLVQLKLAGIEIAIVTGRDAASSVDIMRLTNLEQFIAEMGCVVQFGYGANAQKRYVLGEWTNMTIEELDTCHSGTPQELIRQSGILEILLNTCKGKLEEHTLTSNHREVTCLLRGKVDTKPGSELDCLLAEFKHPLQLLDNGVIHPRQHTLTEVEEVHIYHLMPRGTGKGASVALDMKNKGLVPKQVLGIGDAAGDVDMARYTGSFVLMDNGSKTLPADYATKVAANPGALFKTTKPTADGWLEFAHALLKAKRA